MTYTLTLGPVDLAPDPTLGGEQLLWVDEHEWDPIAQEQERSLNGKLIIQEGQKVYGRPITLESQGGAWFTKATVEALKNLAAESGGRYLLTLPTGATHYVTFNRAEGPAITATPLWRKVVQGPDDLFEITLRLITVAPPPEPEEEEEPDEP